jgi:tripartite-type tricarboxylate transporter receptor subunit TctC
MKTLNILKHALTGAIAVALVATAAAQSFPSKPITFVVPFAAGGPTDKVARDLAEAMRPHIGQQVLVENTPGASGTIAATKVATAASDGHTVLLWHIGMAATAGLYRNLRYKPLEDFEYLGMINESPMTLVGKPTLPVANFSELKGWLNQNKGKVNLANAGLGSASHLCGLMLQQAMQVDMTTVPYRGTAPAMTDLIGGQVDLMCDQTTSTTQQIQGNTIKAFAVTTSKRLAPLPNLPTLDEVGLKGFNLTIWHAIYAPKGTPKAITEKLNAALKLALKDAAFVKKQEEVGNIIVNDDRLTPEGHKKFVADQINKLGVAIKAAGQYAD